MQTDIDLDAFLSAFFQSGATLVAIIAGIIGARFVAAHGDVQGLRDRATGLGDEETVMQRKSARAQTQILKRRAERRASGAQFLDEYVLGQDPALPAGRIESMEVRLHGFFSEFVERLDEYLPRCNELVDAWGDRALSVGTLRQDGAPVGNSFKESVFSHVVKELARAEAERSDEHRRKFANLETEVRRRDSRRHRALAQEIERATEQASVLSDELVHVRSNIADVSKQLAVLESGEGFRLGLRVLALVSTLVIVPPVVLLLLRPDGWGAWWPALTVAVLFGGGVAITLRYLYVYSSFIQGRVPLPNSPLQLLRSQTAVTPQAGGTS